MNIMFVCTGNICRSAMAHHLLEKRLKDLKIENVKVYSCGVTAYNGEKSTWEAIYIMEKYYNVDLKKHRAKNIKNSNIENMDLILCATKYHKEDVLELYPSLKGKVFTMKEYVNYDEENYNKIDIKDPWGYDKETYLDCSKEISKCIELLIEKISSQENEFM